jgi:hypothetical protein
MFTKNDSDDNKHVKLRHGCISLCVTMRPLKEFTLKHIRKVS